MARPQVSVVIPCFNAGDHIRETLQCLRAQTLQRFEVILVDDGSTTEHAEITRAAALEFGAEYVKQENAGPGPARNTGVQRASGSWIAFLDSDDRWESTKLELQLERALQGNNALVLCRTRTITFDGQVQGEHRFEFADATAFRAAILKGDVYSFTSAIFIERDSFIALGGFDDRLRFYEDHHLLYRAVGQLKHDVVPEVLSNRVIHSESMSHLSQNMDFDAQLGRLRLYLQLIGELSPELDLAPLLVKVHHKCIRRSIVLGQYKQAARLSCDAISVQPLAVKSYAFLGAILLANLVPSAFDRWGPDLARLRRVET